MVMENQSPPLDDKAVYLALKDILNVPDDKVRKVASIRKLLRQHKEQENLADLIQSSSFEAVCESARVLISEGIFSSAERAKIRFPELRSLSLTVDAEKETRDARAAEHETNTSPKATQGMPGGFDVTDSTSHSDAAAGGAKEVPTVNGAIPSTSKIQAHPGSKKDSRAGMPSLFPTYLPFKAQHKLLCHVQTILEQACYEFGVHHMPDTLRRYGWDCAEAAELTCWTTEFIKNKTFVANTTKGKQPANSTLESVGNIRHAAVHRNRVSAKAIEQFLIDAEAMVGVLGDEICIKKILGLRRNVHTAIAELERNKHFLSSQLDKTLQKIADQRAELQRQEDLAIAKVKREDAEFQVLAGSSLEEAIALCEACCSVTGKVETENATARKGLDKTNKAEEANDKDEVEGGCELRFYTPEIE